MDVLRADHDVPMARNTLRNRFDRNGWRKEPDRALVWNLARGKKRVEVPAGLEWTHIHLPVCGEDEGPHASSSAATPGNSFPSKNSSDAPPPVDTWVS